MKGAAAVLLALAIGFGAGLYVGSRPGPSADVAASTRDSLAVAVARAESLEAAVGRVRAKASADSAALAVIAGRVAVRPIPPATPADTIEIPDTLTVYAVPLPVVRLVERLQARVIGLEAALDTTELARQAERNARALAESVAAQYARALEAEERKRWRYRLEGAASVGMVGGVLWGIARIFGG